MCMSLLKIMMFSLNIVYTQVNGLCLRSGLVELCCAWVDSSGNCCVSVADMHHKLQFEIMVYIIILRY